MASAHLQRLIFLLAPLLAARPTAGKSSRAAPVAVEARFKERITAKLSTALVSATTHLAWSLGVTDDASEPEASKDVFAPRYEFDFGSGAARWRSRCEADIDVSRDSITHCVMHKLQALTALCEVPDAAKAYRPGISRLLKRLLGKRETILTGLGVKRSLLPLGNGIEAWMSELSVGSGNFDVQVPVHAAAMLTVVQCGSALEDQSVFDIVHSWFAAVEKAYPRNAWDKFSFHLNSILWESFVVISTMIRRGSSFADDLQEFVSDFESYLQAQFNQDAKVWSFSGARAAVLSWLSEPKQARRKKLGKAIDEYMRRWKQLAPTLNASMAYTCGPLQGVAPLLMKRGNEAAELVSSVLRLMEKDVDLFQISYAEGDGASPSIAADRVGQEILAANGASLQGAFLRDEGQLGGERRRSIRVDDTAQCVMALSRTLQLLDDLIGVEVSEDGEAVPPDPPSTATGKGEAHKREDL